MIKKPWGNKGALVNAIQVLPDKYKETIQKIEQEKGYFVNLILSPSSCVMQSREDSKDWFILSCQFEGKWPVNCRKHPKRPQFGVTEFCQECYNQLVTLPVIIPEKDIPIWKKAWRDTPWI